MFTKIELKKQIRSLGITIVKGNYIKKSEIKKVLAGDVINFPTKEYEWGFDLTSINPKIWKKILKAINAKEEPTLEECTWVWKGKDVTLFTGNDPISGKYGDKDRREDEVGYASYIGISGKKDLVEKIAGLIKKHADYIKDESPGERQFI